jgi:hypothetical protein
VRTETEVRLFFYIDIEYSKTLPYFSKFSSRRSSKGMIDVENSVVSWNQLQIYCWILPFYQFDNPRQLNLDNAPSARTGHDPYKSSTSLEDDASVGYQMDGNGGHAWRYRWTTAVVSKR